MTCLVRINRNIVECKDIPVCTFDVEFWVLIETLWNVKLNITLADAQYAEVLIETLWNVKKRMSSYN